MPARIDDYGMILPSLHPGQQMVKDDIKDKEWAWVCAHRGWRKSSLGINLMVEHLLTGADGVWYAPSMKVIETANWIDFKKVCQGRQDWFHQNNKTWTIPGKGTCYFISMEVPGNARGGTFPFAVAEEMGEWEDGVFESYVEPVIRKAGGKLFAPGTPNVVNPNNDFYHYIHKASDEPDKQISYVIPAYGADIVDDKLVRNISPYTNYALTGDYPFPTWQDMVASYRRSQNKERWRIEYLCHFISANSEGIDGVDDACILSHEEQRW